MSRSAELANGPASRPRTPRAIAPRAGDRLGRAATPAGRQLAGCSTASSGVERCARDTSFGRRDRRCDAACTRARRDPRRSTRTVAFGGSVGAGEAYMDGLLGLRRPGRAGAHLACATATLLDGMETGCRGAPARLLRLLHCAAPQHAATAAARNIAAHYDLGNEFFRAVPRRRPDVLVRRSSQRRTPTLEQASIAKLDAICRKLRPGARPITLLEIGTGWGGFALHAARALRLPRHDHDDLARAARAARRERVRAGRPRRPHHAAAAATTATSTRPVTTSSCRSR